MFTNAKTVLINNKEVQSIINSDGGIIYEKPSEYELTLTSNNPIIQIGETATLSATLTYDGEGVSGETIVFYDSEITTVSSNYLEYNSVNLESSFKLYYYPSVSDSNSFITILNSDLKIIYYGDGKVYKMIEGEEQFPTQIFSSASHLELNNGVLSDGNGNTWSISRYTTDDLILYQMGGDGYVVVGGVIGSDVTDSNGVATVSYTGVGVGDVDIVADWDSTVQSNTLTIEDCSYYSTTEYSAEAFLSISMPLQFKLEFDINPTSRSNANGYLRIGESGDVGVWVGQLTSGGVHGISLRPSGGVTCPTNTVLNTDNHITVTYDGSNVVYTCNGETVTQSYSNLTTNIIYVTAYSTEHLKNIKVKPLTVLDLSSDVSVLSYNDSDSTTLTATFTNGGTPLVGETISFYANDTLLGTSITNNNGEATYTYNSEGVGDINVQADWNNTVQSEIFVLKDYLYVPKLDGTENIYQISGTTTISNGEMSGGSSFLTLGFDNTGDWELTGKVKFSGYNCSVMLIPSTETSRDNNEMGLSSFNTKTFWNNSGAYGELITRNRHLTDNTYYDFKITKENGAITTLIDGVTRDNFNWFSASTAQTLCVGVGGWTSTGNVCTIKEIVVKPL